MELLALGKSNRCRLVSQTLEADTSALGSVVASLWSQVANTLQSAVTFESLKLPAGA